MSVTFAPILHICVQDAEPHNLQLPSISVVNKTMTVEVVLASAGGGVP